MRAACGWLILTFVPFHLLKSVTLSSAPTTVTQVSKITKRKYLRIKLFFRPEHFFRMDNFIESFRREKSQGERSFFKTGVFLIGFLGHLGCLVITDMRIERGYQH